jgi:drug/metabolite transporter (DMT)-like permease
VKPTKSRGVGALLIAVYGVFAVSATARASFQLVTKFEDAPLAYSLSALSALVYIVATVALARNDSNSQTVARWAVRFELVGVLVVGTLSLLWPAAFEHPSVWSWFGLNYACLPLVLPIFGLLWLNRRAATN